MGADAPPVTAAERIPDADAPQPTLKQRLLRAWSEGALPAVLVPFGAAACGPQGLAIIGTGVLDLLSPTVPVGLAALGAMAALQQHTIVLPRRPPALTAAVVAEALLTALITAVGIYLLARAFGGSDIATVWYLAAVTGFCAASSSPLLNLDVRLSASLGAVLRERSVLVAIVGSGLLLVWMQLASPQEASLLFAKANGASAIVAVAGVLLAGGVTSLAEQRVFGVAILLLLGGIAGSLDASALLGGLCAGTIWRAAPGAAREALQPVVAYVQHPLVISLLVVAGLHLQITVTSLALAAAYVLLRTFGKFVGAGAAALVCRAPARALFPHLLAPGIFGVMIALALTTADTPLTSSLVTIVILGTAISQLLHSLVPPRAGQV